MAKDFYLTLPSNVATDIFPDNALSHFVTPLHRRIHFPCDFEAAITELHYPSYFENVARGENEILVRDVDRLVMNSYGTRPALTGEQTRTIRKEKPRAAETVFPPWNRSKESSPKDIVAFWAPVLFDVLNEDQKKASNLATASDIIVEYRRTVAAGYYLDIDELLKHINAQLMEVAKTEASAVTGVERPAELAKALDGSGRIEVRLHRWGQEDSLIRKSMFLSDVLSRQLGFDPGVDILSCKLSDRPFNLSLGIPRQIFVYCDFIDPQLVGNVSAPLLRTFHAEFNPVPWAVASHLFTSPYYLPVNRRSLDTVEINLRDKTGEFIPFAQGSSSVVVVVHFRPVS